MKTAELQTVSVVDLVTNDNDKTIAVPAGRTWRQVIVSVNFTTSADAGARQIEIELQDALGIVLFTAVASETQLATETILYQAAANLEDKVVITTDLVHMRLADFVMNAGFGIRILDSNNISGTDALIIRVNAMEQEYPRTLA